MTTKEDAQVTSKEDMHLIRNCTWKFKCTKTWDSLLPAEHFDFERRRYCDDCKENVYLVTNEKSLFLHIEHEHCVAIPFEITNAYKQMNRPLMGSLKMSKQ